LTKIEGEDKGPAARTGKNDIRSLNKKRGGGRGMHRQRNRLGEEKGTQIKIEKKGGKLDDDYFKGKTFPQRTRATATPEGVHRGKKLGTGHRPKKKGYPDIES